MTEEQWLNGTSPKEMLRWLQQTSANERKVRLFICACWRPRIEVAGDPRVMLQDIEIVESGRFDASVPRRYFPTYGDYWDAARKSSMVGIKATARKRHPEPGLNATQQAALLRCLFGNPFRPTLPDAAWLTAAIASLAEAAYEERIMPSGHLDAARLAVLSDALEDAGCTDAAILAHLRSPGPHVRGCWALDLVLGES